jgi:glycosyltransferase involved in cell wall biosynthesis
MTLPITVVVPAYRATETLARALASARGQTPEPPAEILVVDDGSDDGTAELARECGATVLIHEHNRGLAAARNTAVEAATQPWLAFLDADDEWLPHHLATLWPLREGRDLIAGSAIVWEAARQRARFHGPVREREYTPASPVALLGTENYIAISAALARTEAVRAAGSFRPFPAVEDLDLWARLLTAGSAVIVPAVTIIYYVHPGQLSANTDAVQTWHLRVIDGLAGAPWWSPVLAERYRGTLAWHRAALAHGAGRRRQAAGILVRTLTHPVRARALAAYLVRRLRVRREAARWDLTGAREGTPPLEAAARAVAKVSTRAARHGLHPHV